MSTQLEDKQQLEALQSRNAVLEGEIQKARRVEAQGLIIEKMPYKDLQPRYLAELEELKTIEASHLTNLKGRLDQDREFWAKSLKEGDVTGMGETETGVENEQTKGLKPEELKERWVEHDVMYGPAS